ncbi:efflux transporter outer membrane subunit [Dyella choica]|uniref:Efflux transporter outer membrane subunit n=1 Tax=Dyella choica TaxID=1927959 RepID=A0A432M9W1_9GAMM|nr:efflux transporter outer membrane subunit [Dyella choica]RUL78983.1 efflux transporter outer membrane subunit [Dyella choica]
MRPQAVLAQILRAWLIAGATAMAACANTGGIRPQARLLDPAKIDQGLAIKGAETNAAWPASNWWLAWQDPPLDALIHQALDDQPDLQAAQARVDLLVAQARVAGATQFPQLGAHSNLGRERYPRYATPSPPGGYAVWSNSIGASLSYDLDLWGADRATWEAALDAAQASVADLRNVQLTLETAIVRSYIALSLQRQWNEIDRAILDQALRAEDIVKQRLQAGLSNQRELSQARTQVEIISDELEQTNQEAELARHELAILAGAGPGFGDTLTPKPGMLETRVKLPPALPAEWIGHRPDVVAQRWRVESASKGIKVARAAFYPNIDLLATAQLASATRFGGFFNFAADNAAGHRYGVAISLPLFTGGRLQGQYAAAVARYDAAVDDYNHTVLAAMQQVADQVTSIQSLEQQEQHVSQAVLEAEQAHRLAERGYRSGITEFMDVLATQTTLLRQQQQLAQIKARHLAAWALLMQALGGMERNMAMASPDLPPEEASRAR